MADEWWSSTRTADDGGSPCSTAPATDQLDAAAPPSFLADPPHHMDWTQAYM